jgi:WD40 repeat protein
VHVWDAETAEPKCTFKLKEGSRGIAGISISPCQRYVACVDLHNDHHVVIHNIKRNKQLLHIEGGKDKIHHVAWSKKADDLRFVTVGLKELKFWNPADATKRLNTKGTFGTRGKITTFSCAAFDTEGTCYSAGANGMIYTWDAQGQLDKVIKAHAQEITALIHEHGKLISGSKDRKIMVHSTKAGGEVTHEKTIELDGITSYPKSLDYYNGKILVGFRNGSIYEINEESGEKKLLLASHHEGESWGLEVIPEDKTIITTGDDNKIMTFDYANRRFVRQGAVSKKSQPKNQEKAKKVTASTLSDMPPNQQSRAVAFCS